MKSETLNMSILTRKNLKNEVSVWFIHGFTESSDCFKSALQDPELSKYNIFIPDLPGFGNSPMLEGVLDINDIADDIHLTINRDCSNQSIVLVGHSLGGAIAVLIANKLISENKNVFLINIDGLLVAERSGVSSISRANDFEVDIDYQQFMLEYWGERKGENFYLQRYYDNIKATPAFVLHSWAKACINFLSEDRILILQKAIKDYTLYLYGENSINTRNIAGANESGAMIQTIQNSGHWPMLDAPKAFWDEINYQITAKYSIIFSR